MCLDPERFAEAVVQRGPSLQCIALMDPSGQPVGCWEVAAETRALRKLDTAEALEKMAQESDGGF